MPIRKSIAESEKKKKQEPQRTIAPPNFFFFWLENADAVCFHAQDKVNISENRAIPEQRIIPHTHAHMSQRMGFCTEARGGVEKRGKSCIIAYRFLFLLTECHSHGEGERSSCRFVKLLLYLF